MPNNDTPAKEEQSTQVLCVSCMKPFARTSKEYQKLEEKKIPLPTRCPQCRKLNIIEEKLKFIIKLLTNPVKQVVPVKVTTEVTQIKVTKKDPKHEQELPKKPTERVPSKA
jgi:pyruvate-formate lyase-activating enzyme